MLDGGGNWGNRGQGGQKKKIYASLLSSQSDLDRLGGANHEGMLWPGVTVNTGKGWSVADHFHRSGYIYQMRHYSNILSALLH